MSPTTLLDGVTLTMSPKLVDLGVHLRDLVPAMGDAHAGGLFLKIGVLAAGISWR